VFEIKITSELNSTRKLILITKLLVKNMLTKRLQIALIHTAVAMTLVPINSTLNRVMIFDLGISKTLFTMLAIFPSAHSQTVTQFSVIAARRTFL
jgi:hypothetical protein